MNQQTVNKVAIVTGASRGIGRAIALRLAHDGFAVMANYRGDTEAVNGLLREVEAAGGRMIAQQGDVANRVAMERLFSHTQEVWGGIDVVVNSAGIMSNQRIDALDLESFDRQLEVNLRGSFIVLGLAARHVREGGRIIALSSSVIGRAFPTYGPYIATKAGVEGLVHVLANEMRGRGITVNAVAPGPVGTELFFQGKTDEQVEQIAKLAPLERLGTPEDIAGVVAQVAGADGGWINNQVIQVNGGF